MLFHNLLMTFEF